MPKFKFKHNDAVWITPYTSSLARQLRGTVQIIDVAGVSDKYGNWYKLKMFDEQRDGVVWEGECKQVDPDNLHEQGEFQYQLALIAEEFRN